MKRIVFQGVVLILLFFLAFTTLRRVDWVTLFRIDKVRAPVEESVADFFWDFYRGSERIIDDQSVTGVTDSLLSVICEGNGIARESIEIYVVRRNDVNAFALPGGRIVLHSGLIEEAGDQYELAAVIAHELAHIELDHVIKKLTKELGLTFLIAMTSGRGGGEMAREALRVVTSKAYDRNLEREADERAAEYLISIGISPLYYAAFLERMSQKESTATRYITWLSTHPYTGERVATITDAGAGYGDQAREIVAPETWQEFQERVKTLSN